MERYKASREATGGGTAGERPLVEWTPVEPTFTQPTDEKRDKSRRLPCRTSLAIGGVSISRTRYMHLIALYSSRPNLAPHRAGRGRQRQTTRRHAILPKQTRSLKPGLTPAFKTWAEMAGALLGNSKKNAGVPNWPCHYLCGRLRSPPDDRLLRRRSLRSMVRRIEHPKRGGVTSSLPRKNTNRLRFPSIFLRWFNYYLLWMPHSVFSEPSLFFMPSNLPDRSPP